MHCLKKLLLFLLLFGMFSSSAQASITPPSMSYEANGLNISINWTPIQGATGYTLFYAPYPYTGPASIQSVDMGTNLNFSHYLWEGASFYIAVAAYNNFESSGYSNIEQFTVTNQVANIDLTGSWSGTGSSNVYIGCNASLTGTFTMDGTTFGGNGYLDGNCDWGPGYLTGTINGYDLEFGIVVGGATSLYYTGTVSPDGRTMSGTYTWPDEDDSGTWVLYKQ